MKHYKSVVILSNYQNVKSSCADVKLPGKNFLATVLTCLHAKALGQRRSSMAFAPPGMLFLVRRI